MCDLPGAFPVSVVGNLISKFSAKSSSDGLDEAHCDQGSEKAKSSYAEYVSPACHYNEDTLLNKGGELVQIIKVVDYERCSDDESLRDAIRRSIAKVQDQDISFWIYTVREKKDFRLEWKERGDFSDGLHKVYRSQIDAKYDTYANTIYVAVVTKHLDERMSGIGGALLFSQVVKKHKKYLASRAAYLSGVSASIMEELKGFSASKLGLLKCKGRRWRSELLEFLSYLVTFRHRECYLEMCDNSHTISAGCDLHIGFNAFRIVEDGNARYGAILMVKPFIGEHLNAVDECLQQRCEYIITEVIKFVDGKRLKNVYGNQASLLDISGDKTLVDMGHLSGVLQVKDSAFGDACERQVSCTVVAQNLSALKSGVNDMVAAFSSIGALVVRADLALEDCFWAIMPGNFRYVLRMKVALVKLACTFAILHEFPSGAMRGGKWPEAITVFFSVSDLPYFFNFHFKGRGHTMCLGPHDSSMAQLCNFLLSESRRLDINSIVFDYSGKSVIYSAAVGGKYHRIDDRPDKVSRTFNPFCVEDTKINRKTAAKVLCRMVSPAIAPGDKVTEAVDGAIEKIFSMPLEERTQDKICECIKGLGGKVSNWVAKGRFAHILQNENSIRWDPGFVAVNAGMLIGKLDCLAAVLCYLLHDLERSLKGAPTILIMYEAWTLDAVFYTEQEFDEWVDRLSDLNVVIVFASENIGAISSSRIIRYIVKHIDTRIFMPNFIVGSKQHGRLYGLSQEEIDVMLQISQGEGHFFLKQGKKTAVLSLKLPEQERRVLLANRNTIKIMYESVADSGKDWLETFHKRCEALEQQ